MDYSRAQEIFKSDDVYEVVYNGSPVWIEGLDPSSKSAMITSDVLPGGRASIPVDRLEEH